VSFECFYHEKLRANFATMKMKKNIRYGNMRLWMESPKDNKSMALGEVRVYWKFERRDENGEYGVLRIRYAGSYEEPDLWRLRWAHYRDYVVENLPPYLERWYPSDLQEVMAALAGLNIGFEKQPPPQRSDS
jgi:hypothetical protein